MESFSLFAYAHNRQASLSISATFTFRTQLAKFSKRFCFLLKMCAENHTRAAQVHIAECSTDFTIEIFMHRHAAFAGLCFVVTKEFPEMISCSTNSELKKNNFVATYKSVLVANIIRQFELVKRDQLLHPLLASCRRIGVNVHSLRHFRIGFAGNHPARIVEFIPVCRIFFGYKIKRCFDVLTRNQTERLKIMLFELYARLPKVNVSDGGRQTTHKAVLKNMRIKLLIVCFSSSAVAVRRVDDDEWAILRAYIARLCFESFPCVNIFHVQRRFFDTTDIFVATQITISGCFSASL